MELKIYKAHNSGRKLTAQSKKTALTITFRGRKLKWLFVVVKSLAHGTITALASSVRSGFCLVENNKTTF